MRLQDLLADVPLQGVEGSQDIEICEVRDDSRQVRAGDLFVAVRGQTVDGHAFLADAAARGAAAAVVEEPIGVDRFPGTRVRVVSGARALGRIAGNRFGNPARQLTMIGITGTNGKTTTSILAESLIRAAGGEPGVIGTVAYRGPGLDRPAPYTTPTPLELHATLEQLRRAGCTHVAMECSSHALALDRLEGISFKVAAFTNLTQDHLDLHGTMEAYRDAKARLFSRHLRSDGAAVILLDGPYGEQMRRAASSRVVTVSAQASADVTVKWATHSIAGIEAELAAPTGAITLRSPLIGVFNLENLLVGAGVGLALGLSNTDIGLALSSVRGVPGRLERMGAGDAPFEVFVDYAHTPDALERVMAAIRPLTRGRLIVLFGCGGDRDRTKRPQMGRAVARDADLAIVTSDNPRTESPESIVEMIVAGVRLEHSPPLSEHGLAAAERGHVVVIDRRRAISAALMAARAGDVVLIAGKGHEDYQVVGTSRHHFDDREEARAGLEKLASHRSNAQS